MKADQSDPTSQSCSCTSCIYKSPSNRPSLRRMIVRGSRIDKLYYGKYIPLRERKLLNKLVRTRAVYDDVRNLLLSGSDTSTRGKADLREGVPTKKEVVDMKKSASIFELVKLIDAGDDLRTKELNDCCDCCSCSSKINIHKHASERRIHKHRHAGRGGLHKISKSSVIVRHKMGKGVHRGEYAEFSNSVRFRGRKIKKGTSGGSYYKISRSSMTDNRQGMGEGRELQKRVQIKRKHVRSEPCICTKELLSDLIKSQSKAVLNKIRPVSSGSTTGISYGILEEMLKLEKRKPGKRIKGSYQKLKRSKARMMEEIEIGTKKLKHSTENIKNNMTAGTRKSIENLKQLKNNFDGKVRTGIKKSKLSNLKRKADVKCVCETPEEGLSFHIKKDSIMKFKEKLQRSRDLKYYECDYECIQDECVPEECLKKLIIRKGIQLRHRLSKTRGFGNKKETDGTSTLRAQEVQVDKTVAKSGTNTQRNNLRNMATHKSQTVGGHENVRTEKKEVIKKNRKQESPRVRTQDCACINDIPVQKDRGAITKLETKTRSNLLEDIVTHKPEVSGGHKSVQYQKQEIATKRPKEDVQRKTKSITSKTSIPSTQSKPSLHSKNIGTVPKIKGRKQKIPKIKVSTTLPKPLISELEKTSESDINKRQAVRVTSSFSFQIEFSKDKPEIKLTDNDFKKSDSGHGVQMRHRKHQSSKVKMKNNKAGPHVLKRCFCTLKLKDRKRRMAPHTRNSNQTQTQNTNLSKPVLDNTEGTISCDCRKLATTVFPELLPYECEPFVCVPGECDPVQCEKKIRRRYMKYRSVPTNTIPKAKSTSSITTQSNSSTDSKIIQVYSPSKERKPNKMPEMHSPGKKKERENIINKHVIESSESHKRAVRIGSTFSFNVEFYKEKPNPSTEKLMTTHEEKSPENRTKLLKMKRDKRIGRRKHELRHKQSQMSSSTGKSKYSTTKRGLRRCLCTLKLAKSPIQRVDIKSNSKGSLVHLNVDQHNKMIPQIQLKSVATETQGNFQTKLLLSPYECEPGICIPGECDPHECIKMLKPRRMKRVYRRTKWSNTKLRRRSASSLTSRSLTPKSKKVQSSILTYNTTTPVPKYEDKKNESRTTDIKPQAVRISSSFSFNIEFHKNNNSSPITHSVSENTIKLTDTTGRSKIRNKQTGLKEHRSRHKSTGSKRYRKSSFTQVNAEKSKNVGSSMKRCFCTLKLQKNVKDKRQQRKDMMITNSTNTLYDKKELYPSAKQQTSNKATKTKRQKYKDILGPYECEPYVCVPGECNPYECLKRIKKRENQKKIGTIIKQPQMKSNSSLTYTSSGQSKAINAKSHVKRLNTYVNTREPKNMGTVIPKKSSKESVKLGSSFSFQVEFSKSKSRDENYIDDKSNQKIIRRTGHHRKHHYKYDQSLKDKETKIVPLSAIGRKSQTASEKMRHKVTRVKPTLKRCFCTLQLLNKKKQGNQTSKVTVYTAMTADQTHIDSFRRRNNMRKNKYGYNPPYQYKDVHSHFPKKNQEIDDTNTSQIQLKSLHNILTQTYSSCSNIPNDWYTMLSTQLARDSYKLRRNELKLEELTSTTTYFFQKNDHRHQQLFNCTTISLKKSQTENLKSNPSKMTGINQLLRRCYCTMNIHVPARNTGKSRKTSFKRNRLEPYECEPGVCVPGECNPIECQKLILKRQMKRTSKMSATPKARTKSISSSTSGTKSVVKSRNNQTNNSQFNPSNSRSEKKIKNSKCAPSSKKQVVRVGSTFSFNVQFSKEIDNDEGGVTGGQEFKKSKSNMRSIDSVSHTGSRARARDTSEKDGRYRGKTTQSIGPKMLHTGSTAAPIGKRCFCTLKLQKKGVLEKTAQKPLKAQGIITSPKEHLKIIPTNVDQYTNTPKRLKLDPYECEPGVCVLGECNPYECLELIKKRNKNTKELGTKAMPIETKSTSSSTTRAKPTRVSYVQSGIKKNKNRVGGTKSKNMHRAITKRSIDANIIKPSRQAVRLGSTFSFDIKFFKEHDIENDSEALKEQPLKKVRNKYHETNNTETLTKGTGSTISKTSEGETQANVENRHHAADVGPVLKRCFCTRKLQKPNTPIKFERRSVDQKTATRVIKAPVSLHSKSVMTTLKTKPLAYVLKPYECEPGVCVPGECNPYVCEKLIKKRQMRHRSNASATERHRGKSVSNAANTSSITKSTTTRQSKIRKERSIKQRQPRKSNDSNINRIESNPRQIVKIGSSFSFNVEFFKDKPLDNDVVRKKVPEVPPEKIKKSINHSTFASQVLKKETRSKATGVSPFLKRCFCTLKLNKNIKNNKPILKKMATIGTETQKMLPVDNMNRSTHTSTNAKYLQKLEPYECEPGVCVPYECNPSECLERIKKRKIKMHSQYSGTDKYISRSSSTMARDLKKSRVNTENNKIKAKQQHFKSGNNKQIVRVGSSFSFNVEFFKDKSLDQDVPIKPTVIEKKEKNVKTRSQKSKNTGPVDSLDKVRNPRKVSTGSGVGPLLKRCFCTLKLHKTEKQQSAKTQKDDSPINNTFKHKPVSKNVATATKNKLYNLKPYECEPNVCIPGQCDPYECEKRIQRRKKDLAVETIRSSMRTAYSSTANIGSRRKSTKSQTSKSKRREMRPTSINESKTFPQHSPDNISPNRQVVRLGSNFSFNVEFFKDHSFGTPDEIGQPNNKKPFIKPKTTKSGKERRSLNRGTGVTSNFLNHKSQVDAIQESKNSGVGPSLKRCFCTLKLHEPNENVIETRTVNVFQSAQMTSRPKYTCRQSTVSTQTKKNKVKINKVFTPTLDPYECEPGTCVPGQCNPYECLERIKRRRLKYCSTGTQCRFCRNSCSGTSTKSKKMQSRCTNRSKAAFKRLFSPNRRYVRIGSSFSFDIQFRKENLQSQNDSLPKYCRDHKETSVHSQDAQVCGAKTKDKGSSVSKALKRCFCTLKLPKNVPLNSKSNECQRQSKITHANRIEKLKRGGFAFTGFKKQKEDVLRHQTFIAAPAQCIFTYDVFTQNRKKDIRKHVKYCDEMETILPYTPSKFNKNTSKSSLNKCNKKSSNSCKRCLKYNKGRGDQNLHQKIKLDTKMPKKEQRKKNNTESNFNTSEKLHGHTNIKNILRRFARLFSLREHKLTKFKSDLNNDFKMYAAKIKTCEPKIPISRKFRRRPTTKISQTDILKSSKSDRQRYYSNLVSDTKKSKSLKVTKSSKERKLNCDFRQKCSQFQSGDEGQNERIKMVNKTPKIRYSPNDSDNQYKCYCSRCIINCDKQGKNKIMYRNNKLVQLALFSPTERKILDNMSLKPIRKKDSEKEKKLCKQPTPDLRTCCHNCQCDIQVQEGYNSIDEELKHNDTYRKFCFCNNKFMGTLFHCGKEEREKKNKPNEEALKNNKRKKKKAECNKPLFEMRLNSNNLELVNKKEIDKKVTELQTQHRVKAEQMGNKPKKRVIIKEPIKHGMSCPCTKKKMKQIKPKKRDEPKKVKPCVCGSKICAKESRRQSKGKRRPCSLRFPCICGSNVCKSEIDKVKTQRDQSKLIENKIKNTLALRKAMRHKSDKLLDANVSQYKKAGDGLVLAESVFDIAKMGFIAGKGIVGSSLSAAFHPQRSYRNIKEAVLNPSLAYAKLSRALESSGAAPTCRRFKRRIGTSVLGRRVIGSFEQNAVTNYLVHMFDKDPTKRTSALKKHKRRNLEPDFECSTFMGSLRRKPCLWAYFMCPWFYPHCISLLTALRHFSEILLFLLAVVVWSPCIFCCEVCRAFTCCFFCTG